MCSIVSSQAPILVPLTGLCESAGLQERSFLLVLDASSMQEIARAWTEHPVSLGFHGHFCQLASVKQHAAVHSSL